MKQILCATLAFLETYNGAVAAVASVVIAIFTIVLVLVTGRQARITSDTLRLARNEFISTQRPKLRVRNIVVSHPPEATGVTPRNFTARKTLRGQFFAANVGGTDAEITEAFVMIFCDRMGLPMRRPYEGIKGNILPSVKIVAPGQAAVFQFNDQTQLEQAAPMIGLGTGPALYVMGWIEYRDERGLVRRTAFCREFRGGGFHEVENPDYEHEE